MVKIFVNTTTYEVTMFSSAQRKKIRDFLKGAFQIEFVTTKNYWPDRKKTKYYSRYCSSTADPHQKWIMFEI